MILKKTIFGFLLALIIFIPLKASGIDVEEKYNFPLPSFLPNCDKTVYHITNPLYATVDCIRDVKGEAVSQRVCVFPDEYYDPETGKPNVEKYGTIEGVYINRKCGFNDFVQLLANAFNFGLAILAVVALFFLIWGGFGFIIAGGRQEKIQEAKDTLKGTFIGVIIVLSAWMLVNTYIMFVTGDPDSMVFPGTEYAKLWWGGSDCHKTFNKECAKNDLKYGCGGPRGSPTDINVRKLQEALNLVKCNCGPVDGCFGEKTKECVENFQIINNIMEAEESYDESGFITGYSSVKDWGEVGEETWQAIADGKSCKENFKPIVGGDICCLPNKTDLPNAACYETPDKTCGGQTKQTGASGEPLYTTDMAPCILYEQCENGCCVPSDTKKDCYNIDFAHCNTFGDAYTFNAGQSCESIPNCTFKICYRNQNECDYQRITCQYPTQIGSAQSASAAQQYISNYDNCQYGTCFQKGNEEGTWYRCAWTTRKKCDLIADTDFLWNKKINPLTNNIEGTNYHCSTDLYIP